MKKIQFILLFCLALLTACAQYVPDSTAVNDIDITEFTVRERREAFLDSIWGDIPQIGHLTTTPYPNITFTKTLALSFDDIFFYTLVIFEHHPYLINPDDTMQVTIAPDTEFNLTGLPGRFDKVRRRTDENGTHTVTGFHNGIPFEIEFKEDTYDK